MGRLSYPSTLGHSPPFHFHFVGDVDYSVQVQVPLTLTHFADATTALYQRLYRWDSLFFSLFSYHSPSLTLCLRRCRCCCNYCDGSSTLSQSRGREKLGGLLFLHHHHHHLFHFVAESAAFSRLAPKKAGKQAPRN